jgi:hypothetical protein
MLDDSHTSFTFPTLENYCCHCQPCAVPQLEHQRSYCFNDAYPGCPVYERPADQTLPAQFKARVRSHRRPASRLFVLVVCIGLLAAAGWQMVRFMSVDRGVVSMPATLIVPATRTTETEAPTDTAIPPVPSKTVVPPTSLPPQPHALEIPIPVGERQFLLHRVTEGENFEVLEKNYDTLTDVILAINDSISSPLWVDSVIVILPGVKTLDPQLPVFQPHQVTGELSIEQLALELNVDLDLLKYYNNCPDVCLLSAGDWLIVPRPRE